MPAPTVHQSGRYRALHGAARRSRLLAGLAAGLLCLVTGGAASAESQPGERLIQFSHKAMGTRVDITFWGNDQAAAQQAANKVFEEFERIDRLMTSWLPDSDVSRLNASAGGPPVKVGPEVMQLILKSQAAARTSNGAFDITVGSYRGLWKFDQDIDGTIPDQAAVKKRLAVVGHRHIRVNTKAKTVQLTRKGTRITLGGVAKGYAVDRGVQLLRKAGFDNFMVQAGGDLYVSGMRGDRKWRVGIRDPRGDRAASFAIAEVANRTFSTSGDYERSLIVDGVRYHHILNPKTGTPARRSRSVTVLARDALTADIWSTALFVLGHERGLALVNKRPGLDAVFVDDQNQVHISKGLLGVVRVFKPPTPGI